MRRAPQSSEALAAFSGVRTILVPPDIVAVPRRSPPPVKKRTPWRPQPDGLVRTERAGSREWFSDRLFVETEEHHQRAGYGAAVALHACGAALLVAAVLTQAVRTPLVRAASSLVMPAVVSTAPPLDRPSPVRAIKPQPTRSAPARSAPSPLPGAAPAPAPIDAPSSVVPETGAETAGNGAAEAPTGPFDGGIDSVPSGVGTSGSEVRGAYRVGGNGGLAPPRKIKDVKPAFPMRALSERARGSVIIEATIGVDGKVQEASVVHSIPTLDQAALDAVRQWEYVPSMLNGVAVAVVMLVVVTFTIQ